MQDKHKNSSQETFAAAKRMKSYIDTHIQDIITAKALSDVAGYSRYHAARIFKQHIAQTPFEYIREQRLTSAALVLRGGKTKVIDVAFDFMFDSQEGFTRAFTSAFGIAPKRFATVTEPSDWKIPFRFLHRRKTDKEKSMMTEKTAIIFTQIVERPARKLLLRRSRAAKEYFAYCEEFGCAEEGSGDSAPWAILCGIKEALYEPVGLWLPDNMRPDGTGLYAHGVELPTDYHGTVPEGFETIDLPPCKLIVFQGEPYDDDNFGEAIGSLWESVKKFNPIIYGYEYADEIAPRMQLAPMGWRGYIEMRPVREISK